MPGLALVTAPLSFLFINYSNNYSSRQICLHLACLHVYVDVCDWLGLHCTWNWCDRCSNHANKNRFFCLQYFLHVLTSDVVSLLTFPDSTCYYCVTLHSQLLWWSRINRMNAWMNKYTDGKWKPNWQITLGSQFLPKTALLPTYLLLK